MVKRAAALLLVCASIAVWVSCSTTSNRYVFAALPTSSEIVVYREDPASGGIVQLVGSPVTAGPSVQALAMHPTGKFLFAANSGQNNVSVYSISSGTLTESQTRMPAGTAPTLLAIDSAGAFLYCANAGSFDVSVFSIASSGALSPVTQLSGATAPIGLSALNMAVSGSVLYVTGQGSTQGYIEAFPLTNGVLGTPLAGSPYTTGNFPYGLAISPGGTFLYTGNKTNPGSISEFTIQSDGTLLQFANSPIGETYSSPVSLAIDKTGTYLYAANQGNGNLIGYSIGASGSSTPGSLTLISTSPFLTGTQPNFVTADPAGNYIFVGYGTSPPSLQSFALDTSTGTLTSVAALPLTGSGSPTSIVVTP
jgi:6-phosphogluconolactonase